MAVALTSVMAKSRWSAALRYDGQLAGMFLGETAPVQPGTYIYEPVRSLTHFRMHEACRAGRRPRCSYTRAGQTVSFTVVDCPRSGVLVLEDFRFEDGEQQVQAVEHL